MKNSPREILLNHHREADASLDHVCRRLLATELAVEAPPRHSAPIAVTSAFITLASKAWTEVFWSCRLAWAGLAAAWVLALALDLRSLETPAYGARQTRAAAAGPVSYVLMQQHLLSELRDPSPTPPPPQPGAAPQSRREDFTPNPASALAFHHYEHNSTDILPSQPLSRWPALSLAV